MLGRLTTSHDPDKGDTASEPSEGKLYLCVVKHASSNRIVGYSMADRMTSQLAVDALGSAVALRRPASGTVVYSDPLSPISSARTPSSARCATAGWPGRWAESVPAPTTPPWIVLQLPQKNVLNRRRWATYEQLRRAIIVWIDAPITDVAPRQPRPAQPVEFKTLLTAAHGA